MARTVKNIFKSNSIGLLKEGDNCTITRNGVARGGMVIGGRCVEGYRNYDRPPYINSFNGEKEVWDELAGQRFSNVTGIDGKEYPDGTTTADILSGRAKPLTGSGSKTGSGVWNTADNLIGLAEKIFDLRGGRTNETIPYGTGSNNYGNDKGIGVVGIIGIAAGLGLVGYLVYRLVK